MFFRAAAFGLTAETPTLHQPGIVLSEAGLPYREDDARIFMMYGSVRIPALDIEVERTELLRGVSLTLVFAPEQVPFTAPLVGPRLLFPDDAADVGADLVASFHCEIVLPPARGAFYLHASYRQYVSNVVRLPPP